MDTEIKLCTTHRNGSKRVTYRPDYCAQRPWIAYTSGTAGRHFETEAQALAWLNA